MFLISLHISHRRALHLAGCFVEVFAHGEVREQVQICTVHDRTPHKVAVVVGTGAAQVAVVPFTYQTINALVLRCDKDTHYLAKYTQHKRKTISLKLTSPRRRRRFRKTSERSAQE